MGYNTIKKRTNFAFIDNQSFKQICELIKNDAPREEVEDLIEPLTAVDLKGFIITLPILATLAENHHHAIRRILRLVKVELDKRSFVEKI